MSIYKLLVQTSTRLSVLGGMLPCNLQINYANIQQSKNNFKLFSVFFPQTWWFLVLLIAHFGYVALVVNELVSLLLDKMAENDQLMLPLIISIVSDATLVLISFAPRLLVFRISSLRVALISIGEVDQQFNKGYHRFCSTNTRLFTGAFITIAWVISLNVLTYPLFEMLWLKWGTAIGILLLLIKCLIYLQTGTWFVQLHIIYYAVAFRISMLTCFLSADNENTEETPECLLQAVRQSDSSGDRLLLSANKSIKETIESFPRRSKIADKIKKTNFLFYHLSQAASEIGSVFSTPILLVITCSFITITTTLFFVIYSISNKSALFDNICIQLATCLLNIGIMLSILMAADLPVTEVTHLREVVMYLSSCSDDRDEKLEINSLMLTLREDRVQLSAAGLFTVGMDLFPSLFGSVATYLIILLQTVAENGEVSSNFSSNDSMISQ